MISHRGRAAVAAGLLTFGALTACTEEPAAPPVWNLPCPAQAGSAVTLVVGARANSPRIRLPEEVQLLVRQAAVQGKKIQVVGVDGVPTVALSAAFRTDGQNRQIRERDLENFVKQTMQFVADLQPKEPEADLLGALTEAGKITPEGGAVVVMDSGVATTGPLSYRNPDMFGAVPTDVVTFLTAQKLLPDLAKRSVLFIGLGETADPQPQLTGTPHDHVGDLWHTVVEKAGATCVHDLVAAPTRTAIATNVAVTVVQPPKPPDFLECGTTVLPDSSPVGFLVGKAEFRDRPAASATLQSLAQTVKRGNQRITLIGTTSSEGSDAANQLLSEQRAAAVKAELVKLGVPEDRIETKGAGEHWPSREPDVTAAGVLIPTAAARNRSVVVQLACRR